MGKEHGYSQLCRLSRSLTLQPCLVLAGMGRHLASFACKAAHPQQVGEGASKVRNKAASQWQAVNAKAYSI